MVKKAATIKLKLFSRLDMTSEKYLGLREAATDGKSFSKSLRAIELWTEPAERILRFFADYDGGFFLPEKCDAYEPIKGTFDPEDLSRQVDWLSQAGGTVMLKRRHVPRYTGYIENERFPPIWEWGASQPMAGVPDPLVVTYLCFWIDVGLLRLRSIEYVRQFLVDLFKVLEGDYGFLTLERDYRLKNYLVIEVPGGTDSEFVGDNLEKCLPGVYWINLFGKLYVDWFGKQKFQTVPCFHKQELAGGGYLIQSAEDLRYFETAEASRAEAIIDHLGREAFFDIKHPDRVCTVPSFGSRRG